MKEKRVWIGLAVLFAVIGVPQLFWKPSRFGGISCWRLLSAVWGNG